MPEQPLMLCVYNVRYHSQSSCKNVLKHFSNVVQLFYVFVKKVLLSL